MTLKRPEGPAGTLLVLEHISEILKDNPLRDPHVRKLGVWLPPQYDEGSSAASRCSTTSSASPARASPTPTGGPSATTSRSARRGLSARENGATIFVLPDCFTALGGNQYVNSARSRLRGLSHARDRSLRRPRVQDARLPRAPRLLRKIIGGYGAVLHGMKYAKYWGAIADHSGDAYFDSSTGTTGRTR